MKIRLARSLAAGAAALFSTSAAHAFCIQTNDATFGGNDVGIMGCAASGPGVSACDMNGTQLRWATHGTLVFDGNQEVAIASWTRNTDKWTEEYVCRLDLTNFVGPGLVHQFTGAGGVGKSLVNFDRCALTPTC